MASTPCRTGSSADCASPPRSSSATSPGAPTATISSGSSRGTSDSPPRRSMPTTVSSTRPRSSSSRGSRGATSSPRSRGVRKTPPARLVTLLAVGIAARLALFWWLATGPFEDEVKRLLKWVDRYTDPDHHRLGRPGHPRERPQLPARRGSLTGPTELAQRSSSGSSPRVNPGRPPMRLHASSTPGMKLSRS